MKETKNRRNFMSVSGIFPSYSCIVLQAWIVTRAWVHCFFLSTSEWLHHYHILQNFRLLWWGDQRVAQHTRDTSVFFNPNQALFTLKPFWYTWTKPEPNWDMIKCHICCNHFMFALTLVRFHNRLDSSSAPESGPRRQRPPWVSIENSI